MNKMFSKTWFFNLDTQLREMGLDSDDKSFDEIKEILSSPPRLNSDEFASSVSYVILAGGFSQKTAKKIHHTIIKLNEKVAILYLARNRNNTSVIRLCSILLLLN